MKDKNKLDRHSEPNSQNKVTSDSVDTPDDVNEILQMKNLDEVIDELNKRGILHIWDDELELLTDSHKNKNMQNRNKHIEIN